MRNQYHRIIKHTAVTNILVIKMTYPSVKENFSLYLIQPINILGYALGNADIKAYLKIHQIKSTNKWFNINLLPK